MSKSEKFIVIVDARESVVRSWLRDGVSFGGLIASAYAINALIPPSGWLNAALGLTWIMWLAGKGASRKHKMTPDEAYAWLDQHAHASDAAGTRS